MKRLFRNLALGMLLGMPGALYANIMPSDSGLYPPCCGSYCKNATTCQDCKTQCQQHCGGGQLSVCYGDCEAYQPGNGCPDPAPAN